MYFDAAYIAKCYLNELAGASHFGLTGVNLLD